MTVQAEDEIAAANVALGAAFAGQLAVTGTSGPGLDLKAETIGLAVITELPMIIVDVQRAGPSTGLPTKTEQADLLRAMFGRHGESPIPIVAASSPSDCFDVALDAARVAVRYRTPVIILSDSFLQNSSEPWLLPDLDALPAIDPRFRASPTASRSCRMRATRWRRARGRSRGRRASNTASAGSSARTAPGAISYEPENHELMTHLRRQKVDGIATRCRRWTSMTPTATPSCWCSAGARRRARSARPSSALGPAASRSRAPICGWLNPMPSQHRRGPRGATRRS